MKDLIPAQESEHRNRNICYSNLKDCSIKFAVTQVRINSLEQYH